MPPLSRELLTKYCYCLIGLAILINASGLFSAVLNSNDAYFYAVISKNMLSSHNWIDLVYNGQDWLDKPHLPFWLTAWSFKLLGVSSFAYVLPGFLFHLLGAFYTYRLAKEFYTHETGLVAALIYLSSLHLLLSAMDVRAEAYLLGEIMPACYYWLIYDRKFSLRALVLASLFSAMAMMTKGLFVVVTIFSGQLAWWICKRQYWRIISPRWLLAYSLSLLFILPELACLYLQFDAHPEKIIFGHSHVSGLSWYFWGSQFGRFFNSGPIVNTHGNPLFFVHTFLWAFLPWSLVFIAASWATIRQFKTAKQLSKCCSSYLIASFWLTFLMFSATKFQLDHYSNIIMPFAAIICANYLLQQHNLVLLAKLQIGLSVVILLATICLSSYLFSLSPPGMITIPALLVLVIIYKRLKLANLVQILVYPTLAICCAFVFLMLVNANQYPGYAIGYQVAKMVNQAPVGLKLYSYRVNGVINSLNFHCLIPPLEINDLSQLQQISATAEEKSQPNGYYLLLNKQDLRELKLSRQVKILATISGLPQEKFIPALFSQQKFQQSVQPVLLLYVESLQVPLKSNN